MQSINSLQVISDARERMLQNYRKLPAEYFDKKDGAGYLFNNIEYLLSRLPATATEGSEIIGAEQASGALAVYVGVPWCEKICSFCNFAYSTKSGADDHEAYLDDLALETELFLSPKNVKVQSIYFGGGTPSFLPSPLFERHLNQITKMPNVQSNIGIACEFSTSTINQDKLEIMLAAGVNRISTGVQSLDDGTRERANLAGTGREAISAVELALKNFRNFNVDLIYGHPHQSEEDWLATVLALTGRGVPSITLYRLELKVRTTFRKIYINNSETLTEESRARLHYFIARYALETAGYEERPLGWWVKKQGLAANPTWLDYLGVWKRSTPYIGFGQGAFSVGAHYHWKNESNRQRWHSKVRARQLPAETATYLPPAALVLNQFMRHVRTTRSISLAAVEQDFLQLGILSALKETLAESVSWGLMSENEDKSELILTEGGESLIHWIFGDLVRRVDHSLREET